jgi:hypothetical protein
MNGGVSVNNDNTCACVCVNGFSGPQCTVSGDASCTTAAIGHGSSIDGNVTVGSALPRLFNEAGANYSIPLNQTDILSLFSANNLSCTTQNALVTFDGSSQKRRRGLSSSDPSTFIEEAVSAPDPQITPTPSPAALLLGARDESNINSVATSNGILYDPEGETLTSTSTTSAGEILTMMMGGPLQATTTPTSGVPKSSSTPSPSPLSASSPSSPLTTRVLDFARIAVLFILDQTDDLAEATTAQSGIASFLTGMSAAAAASASSQNATSMDMNMSMNMTGSISNTPTDIVLNFTNFTITFPNGTVVGGGKG